MFKLTVKKDRNTGEWISRLTVNGRCIGKAFETDKGAVLATGMVMLAQAEANPDAANWPTAE